MPCSSEASAALPPADPLLWLQRRAVQRSPPVASHSPAGLDDGASAGRDETIATETSASAPKTRRRDPETAPIHASLKCRPSYHVVDASRQEERIGIGIGNPGW